MRMWPLIVLSILTMSVVGCKSRSPRAPQWVQAAPAKTQLAFSGQLGWFLEQPAFQTQLAKFPLAEQSLDLFLKKARINPHMETGRVTFYALDLDLSGTKKAQNSQVPNFLIQFSGFRDPKTLQVSIAESFPLEGSLQIGSHDLPLHVVVDINQFHIRILSDLEDNLWIGDLSALATLGNQGRFPARHPVLAATSWISAQAPIQGFIRPQDVLKDLSGRLPCDLAKELPQGIECLALGITPPTSTRPLYQLELSITGSKEGILQVTPWLQRLVAIATSLPGAPGSSPELLQESQRVGLKCQLSKEQLDAVLSRLDQGDFMAISRKPGTKA